MTNTDSIFGKKRHALVLGGNGFIGSHIVRSLIADGHAVTAVNRGTREWIGDPAMDASILPPTYDFAGGDGITAFRGDASYPRSNKEVAHIICDRKKRKAFADAVDVATGTTLGVDGSWDVVVDLSGFTPRDLRAALTGLKGRTRRYVFVSSDSVYEVCEPPCPRRCAAAVRRRATRGALRTRRGRRRSHVRTCTGITSFDARKF